MAKRPRRHRSRPRPSAVAVSRAERNSGLRIIGGRLRGRRLPVADRPGLRPTGDRVRETLFNWLAPRIAGSRCLDCFAGSGALGFEALSRGAARVVLFERDRHVARQLQRNAETLQQLDDGGPPLGRIEVIAGDALSRLTQPPPHRFDIVFLDPPFQAGLLQQTFLLLADDGWLAPNAVVYLEMAGSTALPPLPPGWRLIRDKRAGQVRYGLARP